MNKLRIYNLISFLIILLSLLFAGFVSSTLAVSQEIKKQESIQEIKSISKTVELTPPNPKVTKSISVLITKTYSPVPTAVPSQAPYTISQPTNSPSVAIQSPAPTPTPVVQTDQVNVSINGSSNFSLSVADGSNHCDVLSKALSDGKMASLNMKYSSAYDTYAVYQINGIGKENQVWWTYSVNGSNPPLGCSHIKVKNNDSVSWTYIGPN